MSEEHYEQIYPSIPQHRCRPCTSLCLLLWERKVPTCTFQSRQSQGRELHWRIDVSTHNLISNNLKYYFSFGIFLTRVSQCEPAVPEPPYSSSSMPLRLGQLKWLLLVIYYFKVKGPVPCIGQQLWTTQLVDSNREWLSWTIRWLFRSLPDGETPVLCCVIIRPDWKLLKNALENPKAWMSSWMTILAADWKSAELKGPVKLDQWRGFIWNRWEIMTTLLTFKKPTTGLPLFPWPPLNHWQPPWRDLKMNRE